MNYIISLFQNDLRPLPPILDTNLVRISKVSPDLHSGSLLLVPLPTKSSWNGLIQGDGTGGGVIWEDPGELQIEILYNISSPSPRRPGYQYAGPIAV